MFKNLLCLLLILASFKGFAQESVTFKTEIKPNKKYSVGFKTTSHSYIEILADEEAMQKLKDSGEQANVTMESQTTMQTEVVTADRDQNGVIPAEVAFRDLTTTMTINGVTTSKESSLADTRILGQYGADYKFKVDSVVGNAGELPDKEALTSMMDNIQSAISYPDTPMKVGDRFKTAVPMNFPMPGMDPMAMNIETEYLLTAIRGGIAYFDLVQSITLAMSSTEVEIAASGSGSGKLEYNIAENYATKYLTELPLDMTLTFNVDMSMKFKTTMITEQVAMIE